MLTYVRTDEVMPFAAGSAFGNGAGYERLSGVAGGALDPQAAHHSTIVNLERCARNARGLVEYHFDWCVLRPVDAARRSGTVIYDITNRGRKMVLHWLQDAPVNEHPSSLADAGNALLLHRGHSIVWSGWDAAPPERGAAMKIRVPHAIGIEGMVRDEWVPGARMIGAQRLRLSYPCANTDQSMARLTMRKQQHDAPVDIAAADWRYDGVQHIVPTHGPFETGSIYELLYPAREPAVLGIGFAAVRDLGAVLRHGADRFDAGALDTRCTRAPALLGFGISQAGRFLRDLVRGGWNRDEQGRQVFDGMLNHVAGSGGVFLNASFAMPERTTSAHQDHCYPEHRFPFSSATARDPLTGLCAALGEAERDLRWMEVNTSSEYWQKGASLIHTDPSGTSDLDLPVNVRAYLCASTQHAGQDGLPTDPGPCVNRRNPHNPSPLLRALIVALEAWVRDGIEAPPSRVPRIDQGTLVEPAALAFFSLPGMAVAHSANSIAPIVDWVHPAHDLQTPYRALVPQVDADGNELGGVRLPEIATPLATYTGWNIYRAPYAEGEMCDRFGSLVPFARDDAIRHATRDPRPSIAARYGDHSDYLAKVRAAIAQLVTERLLLESDSARLLDEADARWPAFMQDAARD